MLYFILVLGVMSFVFLSHRRETKDILFISQEIKDNFIGSILSYNEKENQYKIYATINKVKYCILVQDKDDNITISLYYSDGLFLRNLYQGYKSEYKLEKLVF